MILNIETPSIEAHRYIKQVLNDLQRDLDSHTMIVGEFNIDSGVTVNIR